MKYKIAIEQTDEGYSVSVPGLPGCWSQGATETEAIANIREAIKEYLVVRDAGLTIEEFCRLLQPGFSFIHNARPAPA